MSFQESQRFQELPQIDITTTTVFSYTVSTTGSCINTSLSGTITLNPDDELNITSAVGTDAQILCETEPLVAIVYEFSGGASSATVTGLPVGVTFVVAGNELTISGTPTANDWYFHYCLSLYGDYL